MDSKVAVLAALLMTVMFAGCVDEQNSAPDSETDSDGEPVEVEDEGLTKDSVVSAPQWSVGDFFGHHIFFGDEDAQGTHIDAVVVEAGSTYTLVSDQEEAAKWEAAWDFPMLGDVDAKHLGTTAFGADWNLYDFPLSDGKSWTSTFNPMFSGPRELTLTATFEDKIPTVGQGIKPGFLIQGVNADGEVELMTDYIPEIGWYSELTYFDPMTEATDDFILRVWAMGQGSDWEGTTVTAEAEQLIDISACFAPIRQDMSPNTDCVSPGFIGVLPVEEGADELYGIHWLLAIAGHSRLDLIEPSETPFSHDREATSQSLDAPDINFGFYEIEDPTPGQWGLKWDGEGFVTVGYTQLWTITYTTSAFPAA